MKTSALFIFFILLANIVFAQRTVGALKPGKSVPDITIGNIINYPTQTAKISDFKEKLLILDFWGTTCGACVASMPKLAALQKQFGNNVQILCVSYEPKAQVLNFLKSKRGIVGKNISIVSNDNILKTFFPHQFLPYTVWIKDGIYKAATEGDYLDEANIKAMLRDDSSGLNQKNPVVFDYKTEPVSLIKIDPRLSSLKPIYGYTFTGYLPGLGNKGGIERDSVHQVKRFFYINYPVMNLFALALKTGLPYLANRRILEVKDSNNYVYNSKLSYRDKWMANHCYTIESRLPLEIDDAAFVKQLNEELNTFLNLNGRIELKETQCLALRRLQDTLSNSYPMILPENSHNDLVFQLNRIPGVPPVLDELPSGYKSIDFEKIPRDLNESKAVLKSLGYCLVPEKLKIPIFILTEMDSKPTTL